MITTATPSIENVQRSRRFTVAAFFAAIYATLFLALAVTLGIVWTDGLKSPPNLPLAVLVLVPTVASVAAWSYFATGRKILGWIVAGLFSAFGIPMVLLGILETIHPPQRYEMVTLEVSNVFFGVVCLIGLLLSAALVRELRRS